MRNREDVGMQARAAATARSPRMKVTMRPESRRRFAHESSLDPDPKIAVREAIAACRRIMAADLQRGSWVGYRLARDALDFLSKPGQEPEFDAAPALGG